MIPLARLLDEAISRQIIDQETTEKLLKLNAEIAGVSDDITETKTGSSDNASRISNSEAPRFVRGFHDILITIGIVVALTGLWTMSAGLLVPFAVFGLAEWFVKRQRLALPAFTLTLALMIITPIFTQLLVDHDSHYFGVIMFLLQFAVLALYYWRYRVPVALAALFVAGFGFLFFLIISAFGTADDVIKQYPQYLGAVGLGFAITLFAIAMRFDVMDRLRETRYSDVAFWLHLMTAPLLLLSMFFVLFGKRVVWWSQDPTLQEALVVLGLVTIMAIIGLVIDRRAFVTSGLLSLGAALAVFWKETGIDLKDGFAAVFLAVGIIVLLVGSGWQTLRRLVVSKLPETIQSKVPPV